MSAVNLSKENPDLYQKISELDTAVHQAAQEAGLSSTLVELVKLRISQINGCAFCLRLHTQEAIKGGESTDRLAVLAAWQESQYFSEQEMAALSLAENVNAIKAEQTDYPPLTQGQVAAISWIVILMNSWNRIAIHSHYPVAPSRQQKVSD
ncbi:MAG: carboxymuconolactone decarboxylase family protein [Rothia sp. (in: high G+C Gram-positive bacteria)]|nr:carboxymuconolactone decarboxylase family protein [Rothia sp. (in: high G+C Gram-positive bacteria)]